MIGGIMTTATTVTTSQREPQLTGQTVVVIGVILDRRNRAARDACKRAPGYSPERPRVPPPNGPWLLDCKVGSHFAPKIGHELGSG
jgi:hypothetical protein